MEDTPTCFLTRCFLTVRALLCHQPPPWEKQQHGQPSGERGHVSARPRLWHSLANVRTKLRHTAETTASLQRSGARLPTGTGAAQHSHTNTRWAIAQNQAKKKNIWVEPKQWCAALAYTDAGMGAAWPCIWLQRSGAGCDAAHIDEVKDSFRQWTFPNCEPLVRWRRVFHKAESLMKQWSPSPSA